MNEYDFYFFRTSPTLRVGPGDARDTPFPGHDFPIIHAILNRDEALDGDQAHGQHAHHDAPVVQGALKLAHR